ncbi:hypothetical protein G6O67_006596 [Ophiocordyceps sinensis]|uniref:Uncharacterized protein n=1 Tax=Ophiocordyceps sinensis TaxID=72228 RepID=A0A8H4LW00_9HYPO|nr:hypothetical protein G6O67_006596 [Ophiocordyceps sinensis]
MPGFFDAAQIRDALHNQALPAVEAIAANESLRSLRRFDRDDPPPYASSTDSERLDESLPRLSQEDIEALLDPPCTDEERYWVANTMQSSLSPGELYYEECRFEAVRLERYRFRHMIFRGKKGTRRFGVLVRRNVKRRWQKLGIWNPAWGFPGRNAGPNDKTYTWNWWWRQPGGFTNIEGKQLIDRALLLRQNLRRGESVPVLPRSHLQHDTTPSQADSFLLSRPWFLYRLESSEESEKHYRLDLPPQDPRPKTLRQHVRAWWKDRGDWRDDFSTIDGPLAWKWRHESPSPEPEPLEHFEPTSDEEDNPIETMELTPSEIDALEAIELPSSELPDKFWTISPGDHPPFFPGQQTAPAHVDISKVLSFLAKQTPRSSTPLPREHIEVPPLELQEAPHCVEAWIGQHLGGPKPRAHNIPLCRLAVVLASQS